MALKKFGTLKESEAKSKEVAGKVEKAARLYGKDPKKFVAALGGDPEAFLSKLGFSGEGIRTFRILKDVKTGSRCGCSCYPIACGTGLGCHHTDGTGSSSHSH